MEIIWKPVKGFEGRYEVSFDGKVRSLNYRRTGEVREIAQRVNNDGYITVALNDEGETKGKLVHRLVAEAFLPKEQEDYQVNHIDEDKSNNLVTNLEWCSHKYNMNYGTRNERIAKAHLNGKKARPVKSVDPESGRTIKTFSSIREAGRSGYSISRISVCCRNDGALHRGLLWKYSDTLEEAY